MEKRKKKKEAGILPSAFLYDKYRSHGNRKTFDLYKLYSINILWHIGQYRVGTVQVSEKI